jgi:hypothetical protein
MITFQGRTPINHHQTQKQNQKNKINKIIKKRNENVMLCYVIVTRKGCWWTRS